MEMLEELLICWGIPMKLNLKRRRSGGEPNLTPLIDVIFMLLLFFILTSAFMKPSMPVKLPHASDQDKLKKTDLVISVDDKKQVYLNKENVPVEELAQRLSDAIAAIDAKGEKKRVIFYGDENIPYKVFVKIIDVIKNSGVGEINIAHE